MLNINCPVCSIFPGRNLLPAPGSRSIARTTHTAVPGAVPGSGSPSELSQDLPSQGSSPSGVWPSHRDRAAARSLFRKSTECPFIGKGTHRAVPSPGCAHPEAQPGLLQQHPSKPRAASPSAEPAQVLQWLGRRFWAFHSSTTPLTAATVGKTSAGAQLQGQLQLCAVASTVPCVHQ